MISTDLDETARSLNALHPGDGDAWRRLHAEWRRVREPLLDAMLGPFPPVRAGVRLAGRLRRDLLRFARFSILPARRLAEEHFGGEGGRRLLAGAALHSDVAPETALGGFLGWLLCMIGQDDGFPVPEGGAGQLTAALLRRLGDRAEVRCGAPVEHVVIDAGCAVGVDLAGGERILARRAVLADVDAPRLMGDLVGPSTSRSATSTTSAASNGTTPPSRSTGTSIGPSRGRSPMPAARARSTWRTASTS